MGISLGPLRDGQRVIIIGGGPAGTSCAITLRGMGKKLGREIDVILYEGRVFDAACIKRVGVLAPPIVQTFEEVLGVPFPCQVVERRITGYYLHSGDAKIRLYMGGNISYVGHNVAIDAYLLEKARELGVRVVPERVKEIRLYSDAVAVGSDLGEVRGDVLVGASGLDADTAGLLEGAAPYRRPKALYSVVTKIPAHTEYLKLCEDYVHVFLPTLEDVEFGVVTPKLTNFIVNVAGPSVNRNSLERFLCLPEVRGLVPSEIPESSCRLTSHPLAFPLEPARSCFGDRFVMVGDTAGLVRPYKGNGINSACVTGARAAEVMLKIGISHEAFRSYYDSFHEVVKDLAYGRAIRTAVIFGQRSGLLPGVLKIASKDRVMVNTLIDFISGSKSYHRILKDSGGFNLITRFLRSLFPWSFKDLGLTSKLFKHVP